jgi:DNA-binding transcriptional LysR family regulator
MIETVVSAKNFGALLLPFFSGQSSMSHREKRHQFTLAEYSELCYCNGMTIEQMRCFISVAEALNFTKGAKRLYRSQQVVSRQIANLEKELGFRLFCRSTKHVALTQEAEILLPEWKKAVAGIDGSIEDAKKLVFEKNNTLKIGIVDAHKAISFSKRSFIEYLGAYSEKVQKVTFEHQVMSAGELTDLLLCGDIDLIIVLASELFESDTPGIEVRVLMPLEEYIVFSKRHPFAMKSKIAANDLSEATLLLPSSAFSHIAKKFILNALKAKQVTPKEIKYYDTIDDMELSLYEGKGFAITPDIFFENTDGNLVFQRFSMPKGKEEALAAAWSKKNESRRVLDLIEYLTRQ